ncbi:hypothetical protein [Acetoanaerobium noterae]|uniref:hypothetical protein n=1 Tax=Acetoanaerobium noterae TaxID=745369 RepID=UPI003328D2F2
MIKVGFGTVVYSEAYNYVNDYIDSINNQNYDSFDMLMLDDNLSDYQHQYIDKNINKNIKWIDKVNCKSIQELRIKLIIESKNKGYDLLILGDFDDTFSLDRISNFVSNFDCGFSFFYNDLYYLNENKPFFQYLPLEVDSLDYILESNFLGLSNTALNLNHIEYDFLDKIKLKKTIAFDWMLYTLILLRRKKGKKVNECKTYYRIHNQNTAGDISLSDEGLIREIDIKINHYKQLAEYNNEFKLLLEQYLIYRNSFNFHKKTLYNYSNNVNNYWWGNINTTKIRRSGNYEDK